MEKVAISIDYNGKVITSDFYEKSKEDISKIESLCDDLISGRVESLSFDSGIQKHFFPKGIIQQSVITIIYDK